MHVRSSIIRVIIHHCSLFRAAENHSVQGVSAQNGNYIPGYCYGAPEEEIRGANFRSFSP